MFAIAAWIVSAIVAAWSLISGVAAVAGAGALASALALLPGKQGSTVQSWLNVANYYLPLNEVITLFITYCAMASLIKVAKWTVRLKK